MNQFVNTIIRIKNAILYKQGVHFPFSKVRVWALHQLGHTVGKDVYFPADITITQTFVYNRGSLAIGDRVSIASGVILTLVSHANSSRVRSIVGGAHTLYSHWKRCVDWCQSYYLKWCEYWRRCSSWCGQRSDKGCASIHDSGRQSCKGVEDDRHRYEFTQIEPTDEDWRLIENTYDSTCYKTKQWMDYLEFQGWNPVIVRIEENGQILGFFIGAKIKRLLSIIASPFEGTGTAHQGLSMLIKIPNETRIEIYRQLSHWIFENKIGDYLQIEDWQLRMEDVDESLDIYTEPHRVMYIDLSIPEDDLYHNMHEDCRYSIRKSLKNGLIVKEATDVNVFLDAFYEQYKEVYAKRGDVAPKSKQNIANLIRCLYPNHVLLLETVTREGEIAATGIIPLGSNYASTWQTASYKRLQKLRPNEILRWEAMRLSKERGITTLNMCGTPAFKEKFGTQLVLCPRLIFCRYTIIIKLKTMTKKIYYKLRRTPIINKLL